MKKLLLAFAAGVCLSACATHDPKISIVSYPTTSNPARTFAVKGEGVVCDSRADERTQRSRGGNSPRSWRKLPGGENP